MRGQQQPVGNSETGELQACRNPLHHNPMTPGLAHRLEAITRVGDVLLGDPVLMRARLRVRRCCCGAIPPINLSPFPGRSDVSFPTPLAVVDLAPSIRKTRDLPLTATVHEANTTAEGTQLDTLAATRERENTAGEPSKLFPLPMQTDSHPPLAAAGRN